MNTVLETSAGLSEDGSKVEWQLCLPGGGDTILYFAEHVSSEDQELWANRIMQALTNNS